MSCMEAQSSWSRFMLTKHVSPAMNSCLLQGYEQGIRPEVPVDQSLDQKKMGTGLRLDPQFQQLVLTRLALT